MEITDIKFRHVEQSGKLRALVSVTFDGVLAVHDIKIIDGHDRLFLAMPSACRTATFATSHIRSAARCVSNWNRRYSMPTALPFYSNPTSFFAE